MLPSIFVSSHAFQNDSQVPAVSQMLQRIPKLLDAANSGKTVV
jgi:hypothetical protein